MNAAPRPWLKVAQLSVALSLAVAGAGLLGRQGYVRAKGLLAEQLIGRAFAAHLADGRPHPPWSWADIYPIAELGVQRLGVRRPVLTGASGSSLAFGLGHVDGTAAPGQPGNCVLAGHRDSWAEFMQELEVGDTLSLRRHGGERQYRVQAAEVVDKQAGHVLARSTDRRLTLVTCWPFGGLTRGRERYVVHAIATK